MTTIYMEQTIMLMGEKDPEKTNKLIQSGVIKELNGVRYLVIYEELEKTEK
jgi:hypothetical protein